MSDVAISLKGVSKYYKLYGDPKDRLKEALNPFGKKYHHEFYALKDINLEIKKGEILGIVGRNGSGKSTLLKLICGVLTPNQGSVHVDGKISALLELGAGFNPEFTGIKNIYFYATILGLSNKEIDEKLDEIIDFAELGEFMDQPIKTYSSGMKARLGFAVAVHIDPEILILDEVLAVGDVLFRRKCYAKMEEFFKSGKTIIYTSHDTNSINELCTRAVFIDRGSILMVGSPKDVSAHYQKYLFSAEENKAKVLAEIVLLFQNDNLESKQAVQSNDETIVEQVDGFGMFQGEDYLPGFISKQRVKVSNAKVSIEDSHIINSSGNRVNVLIVDRLYTYVFKVKFCEIAEGVSFGAEVSNLKGLFISSGALWHSDRCMNVDDVDSYTVKWGFHCHLLEGTYFFSSGCSALINGERRFLARIQDAYMFKVLSEENSLCRGLVGLLKNVVVEKQNDGVRSVEE